VSATKFVDRKAMVDIGSSIYNVVGKTAKILQKLLTKYNDGLMAKIKQILIFAIQLMHFDILAIQLID